MSEIWKYGLKIYLKMLKFRIRINVILREKIGVHVLKYYSVFINIYIIKH